MHIIYLDNDNTAQNHFMQLCTELSLNHDITLLHNTLELTEHIKNNKADLIFTEALVDGTEIFPLCETIKTYCEKTCLVLITNTTDYAEQAFDNGFFGYIKKTCTTEKLHRIFERYSQVHPQDRKIEIKTFGRFEVFSDGKAIHFSNKKAKELLALLVDRRGGFVTMEQAIDTLWENRAYDECTKTLYRTALKNLRDTLTKSGCADILVEKRGQRCINKDRISCDYYNFIDDPSHFSQLFNDEYMIDYSWSEFTLAQIVKIYEKTSI